MSDYLHAKGIKDLRDARRELEMETSYLRVYQAAVAASALFGIAVVAGWVAVIWWVRSDAGVNDKAGAAIGFFIGLLVLSIFAGVVNFFSWGLMHCCYRDRRKARWRYEDALDEAAR